MKIRQALKIMQPNERLLKLLRRGDESWKEAGHRRQTIVIAGRRRSKYLRIWWNYFTQDHSQ